jgi:AcrR family transcriptional regulator
VEEEFCKRKEAILSAATDFFARSGYRNTDVQQIADKVQIGKGTVYRYFPSKEALFFAACDRAMLMMEEYVKSQVLRVPLRYGTHPDGHRLIHEVLYGTSSLYRALRPRESRIPQARRANLSLP